jgi:hypothetical protein
VKGALREAHRLFLEIGATARAEQVHGRSAGKLQLVWSGMS